MPATLEQLALLTDILELVVLAPTKADKHRALDLAARVSVAAGMTDREMTMAENAAEQRLAEGVGGFTQDLLERFGG